MIEYDQRDETLRAMGFESYAAYLDSKRWRRIRHRVLKRRGTCVCCGETATEVHHKDYRPETLSGADLGGLVPLCSTCHDLAEFDTDGSKATLVAANQKIDMLASLDRTEVVRHERPWRERKAEAKKLASRSNSYATKKPSKRKLILAGIPPELLPPVPAKGKKLRSLSRSMRMQMPLPKDK